jgi:hypothetical protein
MSFKIPSIFFRSILRRLREGRMPMRLPYMALACIEEASYEALNAFGRVVFAEDGARMKIDLPSAMVLLHSRVDGQCIAMKDAKDDEVVQESDAINTFYHECFHAYFEKNLRGNIGGPETAVFSAAKEYYRGAPLAQTVERPVSETELWQAVHEAGAAYVGKTAQICWLLRDGAASIANRGRIPKDALGQLIAELPTTASMEADQLPTNELVRKTRGNTVSRGKYKKMISEVASLGGSLRTLPYGYVKIDGKAHQIMKVIFGPLADYCDVLMENWLSRRVRV